MASLSLPGNGCLGEPTFSLIGDGYMTCLAALSSEALRQSIQALVSTRSKLSLYDMLFSEEQWQLLQSMPFQAFEATGTSDVDLGEQFFLQTRAKEVRLPDLPLEYSRYAFAKLRMRQQPIGVFEIGLIGQVFIWETTANADNLLSALVGVSNLIVHDVKVSPSIWAYIWRTIR